MSEKEKILNKGLIEQYVLGLLDEQETLELEQHFKKYPELLQHKEAIEKTMEQILLNNAIASPPNLGDETLESLEVPSTSIVEESAKPMAFLRGWLPFLAVSIALMMTFLSFLSYQGRRDAEVELVQLQSKYEALKMDCNQVQASRDILLKQNTIVKNSQRVVLSGSSKAPEALAVVYWNENERAAYIDVLKMPEIPSDKEYQLWADVEGEMINIGKIDEKGVDLQSIAFIEHAESLNITLEPKGNNRIATVSELYLNGKV